jgi:hypothetical protein
MEIVSALFAENISLRQVPGPSTRIDLSGIFFSIPQRDFPTRLEPHLVVMVREPNTGGDISTLVVEFTLDDAVIATNRQSFAVEPGKFGYRLVKPDLVFDAPGTVYAKCEILESGSTVTVPLTVFPSS